MVDRTRRKVEKQVDYIDIKYTTLGQLLEEVKSKIKSYGKDARVDDYNHEYDEKTYSGGIYVSFDETDDEMALRISREEDYAAYKLKHDLQEFARLKAKFGIEN